MTPSAPIRILLVELPKLVRDLVAGVIDRYPDMRVVGEAEPGDDVGAQAALVDAQLVIVGLDGTSLPASAESLLERRASLHLLGIAERDDVTYLYRLRPERRWAGRASAEDITAAIRDAVGSR